MSRLAKAFALVTCILVLSRCSGSHGDVPLASDTPRVGSASAGAGETQNLHRSSDSARTDTSRVREELGPRLSVYLGTGAGSASRLPGELYLQAPDGRGVGFRASRGSVREIPGAFYDSASLEDDDTPGAPQGPSAPYVRMIEGAPIDTGGVTLFVTGLANGSYTLELDFANGGRSRAANRLEGSVPIERGAVHQYHISIRDTVLSIQRIP